MRVVFDGRGINWYKGTGIGTYTYNLLKSFNEIDTTNNYHIFWSGYDYEDFNKNGNKILMASRRHQNFFEKYYIPNYIKKEEIDLYHIPQNGLGLMDNINCKKVVTIHDLIPYVLPETVGKGYLKRFLESMPYVIENSDAIITVSHYSKKDILKFFPFFNEDKIFVTPLAANSNYKLLNKEYCYKKIQNQFNLKCPYLLYLGGFSQRKNVKMLINSFSKVYSSLNQPYCLLIAGSLRDEGEYLKKYCKDLNIQDKVIFCGYVNDDELPILYNGATAFIYPSTYEGFGLPPLESISCGTPVIASNSTSIPEVVEDCGILIDPFSTDSIANGILSLLNDKDLYTSLCKKGLDRSKEFSWTNTAKLTLESYLEI